MSSTIPFPTALVEDVSNSTVAYCAPKPSMLGDDLVWVAVMKGGSVWLYFTDLHADEYGEVARMVFGWCDDCGVEHGNVPEWFNDAH